MHVKKFYSGEVTYDFNQDSNTDLNNFNLKVKDLIIDSIIMNNDSKIEMSLGEDPVYEASGNGTEVAMLRFLQANNVPVHELLTKRQRESEHECSIPFSPLRKR
jgi:magnesium-transporting ATPase (P-type)